ncbi:hypothetical protein AeMF1_011613 [Aphanomyces euteiches]|nr:hypothetical protein AeMF1_011613 [Aphanomyces euteiches]KAH9192732.1 hypothetical protein AeNC1_005280 [Aphanomyces euteiches]
MEESARRPAKKRTMSMRDVLETTAKPKGVRPTRSTSVHAPPVRQASSIARLHNGQDVCVVAHRGSVDWLETFYLYGFDKNSLFCTLMPLRHEDAARSTEESAYMAELFRLLETGKMQLPRGKTATTYIAEKLHSPDARVHRHMVESNIQPSQSESVIPQAMSADEVTRFKEIKVGFLRTLEAWVIDRLHERGVDQSWVVSVKY